MSIDRLHPNGDAAVIQGADGRALTVATPTLITPTGFEDPGSGWSNEANAYDNNNTTSATASVPANSWQAEGDALILTHSEITECDSILWYLYSPHIGADIDLMKIDVYYDSDWHNIYDGVIVKGTSQTTYFVPANVTKVRFRFHNNHGADAQNAAVSEVDFYTHKHWAEVDEWIVNGNTHDGATTTVAHGATESSWKRDLYNVGATSGSGTITKITVKAYAMYVKLGTPPSTPQIKLSVKPSGGAVDEKDAQTLTEVWTLYTNEWTVNPADSEAWEWADLADLQIGVNLYRAHTDSKNNGIPYCTQIYVEVESSENVVVTPETIALTTTKYAPVLKEAITPAALALVLTEYAPSIVDGTIVTPTTLAQTLTEYAPVLKEAITPVALALVLTEYAPVVTVTGAVEVTPPAATLTITGFSPVLKEVITPTTLVLSLTEYAPVLGEAVTPATLALVLTEYAPPLIIGTVITPATLSLILSTYAPTLWEVVTPSKLDLILTEYIPVLQEVITPETLDLILTEYVPVVITTGDETVIPATLDLILTEYIPVVLVTQPMKSMKALVYFHNRSADVTFPKRTANVYFPKRSADVRFKTDEQ